jgi:hypothetical protein
LRTVDHTGKLHSPARRVRLGTASHSAVIENDAIVIGERDIDDRSALEMSTQLKEILQQAQQALASISERAPQYLELSARLAQDARIATRHPTLLDGLVLNSALFRIAPGAGALLLTAQRLLRVLRILQTLLREAQPAVIDEHLAAAGLTRDEVDADVRALTATVGQLTALGVDSASRLASEGARLAGRLLGKSLKARRPRETDSA